MAFHPPPHSGLSRVRQKQRQALSNRRAESYEIPRGRAPKEPLPPQDAAPLRVNLLDRLKYPKENR